MKNDYEVHELASLVPMAIPDEQRALTLDIKEHGQKVNAVLYKGKVIDGRCRMQSCNDLGLELNVESLPHNTTLKDAYAFVSSLNTRRNLTQTQKAIIAYREYLNNQSMGQQAFYEKWSVGDKTFKSAGYLVKNNGHVANQLFNGELVDIVVGGIDKKSHSVQSIARYYKKLADKVTHKTFCSSDADDWNPESKLKTEQAKQYYARQKEYFNKKDGNFDKWFIEYCNGLFIENKESDF